VGTVEGHPTPKVNNDLLLLAREFAHSECSSTMLSKLLHRKRHSGMLRGPDGLILNPHRYSGSSVYGDRNRIKQEEGEKALLLLSRCSIFPGRIYSLKVI
jgi:hypothetical protein